MVVIVTVYQCINKISLSLYLFISLSLYLFISLSLCFHLVPTSWILLNSTVCYGAKNDDYGSFQFDRNRTLVALRFTYLYGQIDVDENEMSIYEKSNWGYKRVDKTCEDNGYCFSIIVTNVSRNIIFPIFPPNLGTNGLYDLPGYDHMDEHIVFKPEWLSMKVFQGEMFHIWFGQDLFNYREDNNRGENCIMVEASYYE